MEEQKPRRRRRLVLVLCIVGLIVVALIALIVLMQRRVPKVQAMVVQKQTIANTVFAAGVVKPVQRQVLYTTDLSSPITQIDVQAGESVKAGQLVASCENSSQQAALSAAKTSLAQANASLSQTEQQMNAAPAGFRSQFTGTLSQERTAVAQAQAQLAQAQAAYNSTLIHSRLTGTVLEVNQDGIAPDGSQAPVLEIVGTTKQVVTNVSQVDAVHLKKGLSATIDSDAYPNQKWTGTVDYISPYASTSSNTSGQVEVHITLPGNAPIPVGYAVNVHITSQTHKGVLVVPYASLVQSGSDYAVFLFGADGRVHETPVTLGITTDTEVEVTSGLKPGQTIVDNPPATLANGSKVDVVNP